MTTTPADLSRRIFLDISTRIGVAAGTFTILRPDQVRGQGRQKLKAGIVGTGPNSVTKSNLELLPKNIESDPKLGIPAPPVPGEYKLI